MECQLAIFRHCLGDATLNLVQTFVYDKDEDKQHIDTNVAKLGKFCFGEENETYGRYTLNRIERKVGKDIDTSIVVVKALADMRLLHEKQFN